jgi:hypothetical protein
VTSDRSGGSPQGVATDETSTATPRDVATAIFAASPGFTLEVVGMVCDGEHGVVQPRATGTFTGTPFYGIHATGRRIEPRGDVMRFEQGQLKHNTIYYRLPAALRRQPERGDHDRDVRSPGGAGGGAGRVADPPRVPHSQHPDA